MRGFHVIPVFSGRDREREYTQARKVNDRRCDMFYLIKATWAGFTMDTGFARSSEEAEELACGTEYTNGIRDRFMAGGYDKAIQGVTHRLKVLCVDILREGQIVRSFNFSR